MSAQYGELRPINSWDLLASLRHPSKFQRVSRVAFVTAATSLTGGQWNFARCLAVSCAGTLYIHFRGSCPLTEFCPLQNPLYVQVLRSFILAALLQGTTAAGVSQTLRRRYKEWNYGTFADGATSIFGSSAGRPSRWAIGPHCSCYFMFCNGEISIILFTCPFLFITLIRWPRVEIIQVADALTNLLTFSHSCLNVLSFGVVCITSTGALYSSFRTLYTNASVCAVFVLLTAKWLIYCRVAQNWHYFCTP